MAVLGPARKPMLRGADLLPWGRGGDLRGDGVCPAARPVAGRGVGLLGSGRGPAVRGRERVRPAPPGSGPYLDPGLLGRAPRLLRAPPWPRVPVLPRLRSREAGLFPRAYSVIALPEECDDETLRCPASSPPEDSRLLGVGPGGGSRFEHRGGDYVDEARSKGAGQVAAGGRGGVLRPRGSCGSVPSDREAAAPARRTGLGGRLPRPGHLYGQWG